LAELSAQNGRKAGPGPGNTGALSPVGVREEKGWRDIPGPAVIQVILAH